MFPHFAILAAGGAAGLECVNFPEQRESRMRAGMDDPSAVFDDDYDSEDDDDDDAPA